MGSTSDGQATTVDDHLFLKKDVGISIKKDSALNLRGVDGDGWIKADPTTAEFIQVWGDLERHGEGDVVSQLPVLVRSGGDLHISGKNGTHSANLLIFHDGVAGTNNASLWVEDNGTVHLGTYSQNVHRGIWVSDEVVFDGGELVVRGSTVSIEASSLVRFTNDATLLMQDGSLPNSPLFTTLSILFNGPNAKVDLVNTRWFLDVKGGATPDLDVVEVYGGDLVTSQTNTGLFVTGYDTIPIGTQFDIFKVHGGQITGNFALQSWSGPVDFDITTHTIMGADIFRLTAKKKANN